MEKQSLHTMMLMASKFSTIIKILIDEFITLPRRKAGQFYFETGF